MNTENNNNNDQDVWKEIAAIDDERRKIAGEIADLKSHLRADLNTLRSVHQQQIDLLKTEARRAIDAREVERDALLARRRNLFDPHTRTIVRAREIDRPR